MKFRYKKFGPGILRPVIPVGLEYKTRSITHEVLVDSGADFCIFDAEVADILEINLKSGEEGWVSGITGVKEPYYVHRITIRVGGWPYPIKVGFLPRIAKSGYGVVGQKGFFDVFIVKFDLLKEEIEIKERK